MKLTTKQREEMIVRLEDDMTDVIIEWALRDNDSLRAYVSEERAYADNTDIDLVALYEAQFNDDDCCENCEQSEYIVGPLSETELGYVCDNCTDEMRH